MADFVLHACELDDQCAAPATREIRVYHPETGVSVLVWACDGHEKQAVAAGYTTPPATAARRSIIRLVDGPPTPLRAPVPDTTMPEVAPAATPSRKGASDRKGERQVAARSHARGAISPVQPPVGVVAPPVEEAGVVCPAPALPAPSSGDALGETGDSVPPFDGAAVDTSTFPGGVSPVAEADMSRAGVDGAPDLSQSDDPTHPAAMELVAGDQPPSHGEPDGAEREDEDAGVGDGASDGPGTSTLPGGGEPGLSVPEHASGDERGAPDGAAIVAGDPGTDRTALGRSTGDPSFAEVDLMPTPCLPVVDDRREAAAPAADLVAELDPAPEDPVNQPLLFAVKADPRPPICIVEGCDAPYIGSRGLCKLHYQRVATKRRLHDYPLLRYPYPWVEDPSSQSSSSSQSEAVAVVGDPAPSPALIAAFAASGSAVAVVDDPVAAHDLESILAAEEAELEERIARVARVRSLLAQAAEKRAAAVSLAAEAEAIEREVRATLQALGVAA